MFFKPIPQAGAVNNSADPVVIVQAKQHFCVGIGFGI
jgi:hypothetical protein